MCSLIIIHKMHKKQMTYSLNNVILFIEVNIKYHATGGSGVHHREHDYL